MVYDGQKQSTEPPPRTIVTDFLYEVFVLEDKTIFYCGSYRCIKKTPIDWDVLTSLGQEVSTVIFPILKAMPDEVISL